MRLEKVKEILELNIKEAGKQMPPDAKTALEIALAAVNRELILRHEIPYERDGLLPGETNE